MFDQKPSESSVQKGQPPVSLPAVAAEETSGNIVASADDIFSKIDSAQPEIFRPTAPGQASQMPVSEDDLFGRRSSFLNKLAKAVAVIVMLAVLALIGWAAYKYVPKTLSSLKNGLSAGNSSGGNINQSGVNGDVNRNLNTEKSADVNTDNGAAAVVASDIDGDGLSDEEERALKTDAKMADSDNDGLIDYAEIKIYQTDPLNADSDSDGYKDGHEVINGYNPNGVGKILNLP